MLHRQEHSQPSTQHILPLHRANDMVNATTLLGVVLLARHGDRLEFFQDPFTYDPAETFLTPLGSVRSLPPPASCSAHESPLIQTQELQLGTFLRSTYLDPASPTFIEGVSPDVADIDQLVVRADAAGEGSVILMSVQGLLQGLFPPTPDNNITLANGTTVISPLGGYQYIPGTQAQRLLSLRSRANGFIPSRECRTKSGYFPQQFHVLPGEYEAVECTL